MSSQIIGFVFRATDFEKVTNFYECLGLSFASEQHQGGPVHLVCQVEDETVLEVYPRGRYMDNMMVVRVDSVTKTLKKLKARGFLVGQTPETSKNNKDTVIYDPEGRLVYLQEPLS